MSGSAERQILARILAGCGCHPEHMSGAVTRCDECGQSSIDAGGQSQPLDQTVAEMVACDSQHVGSVDDPQVHSPHPGAAAPHVDRPRATQTIKQTQARALVDAVLRAGPPHDLAAFVHAALRGS
jgi:hypothetical protein